MLKVASTLTPVQLTYEVYFILSELLTVFCFSKLSSFHFFFNCLLDAMHIAFKPKNLGHKCTCEMKSETIQASLCNNPKQPGAR